MLEQAELQHFDTLSGEQAKQYARQLLERLGRQLKFEQTKNQALNFELMRLKQWRFGSSRRAWTARRSNSLTPNSKPS